MSPNVRPYDRSPRRTGLGWLLGLAALFLIGAFVLFSIGRDANVARNDGMPATTTGSGSAATTNMDRGTGTNPPAATPTTPAPTRQ